MSQLLKEGDDGYQGVSFFGVHLLINPLAFLRYDEKEIYVRIEELGWQAPKDTDPNFTNCLLNAFANQVHIQKHKYNPYAMEMTELVREGILSVDEVLRRTNETMDSQIIEEVKKSLESDAAEGWKQQKKACSAPPINRE